MTYKLSTKGNKLEVSLEKNELVTKVDKTEYSVSLSRTGGQGSKGDSVTDAYFDANQDFIIDVTTAAGLTTQINVGNIGQGLLLAGLGDVILENLQEDDFLIYNEASNSFENHQLTTAKLIDIDNTNRTDGSVLVYNGTTSKYTATNQINNPNLVIVGGNF